MAAHGRVLEILYNKMVPNRARETALLAKHCTVQA